MFAVTILVSPDGKWALSTTGAASMEQVAHLLKVAHEHITAPIALPEGWEATSDGVNILSVDGAVSHSRRYQTTPEGYPTVVREAPCAPDGSPTSATVSALLAPDAFMDEVSA